MPRIPHKIIDGVEHKCCTKCNNWKMLTNFHKCKKNSDTLDGRCKACRKLTAKMRYKKKRKHILETCKTYQQKNREKISAYQSKWQKLNRERINKKRRLNNKKRRKNDPSWALKQDIGSRLNHILAGRQKCESTLELLGCSKLKLMCYLESQFSEHMKWSNRGKFGWHTDHRVPCCSFDMDNELERRVCWWYKNFQPLWWKENIKEKRDKYKEEDKQALIKEWIFYNI